MNTGCRSSLSHRDEGPSCFMVPLPVERQLNAEPDGLDGLVGMMGTVTVE